MDVVCITSGSPGLGKTALAAALVKQTVGRGQEASYFRPSLALEEESAQQDTAFIYSSVIDATRANPDISTEVAVSDTELDENPGDRLVRQVLKHVERVSSNNKTLVIEIPTIGGPPNITSEACFRVAETLDAGVVVVLGYTPTLTSARIAARLKPIGNRLKGFLVNSVPIYRCRKIRHHLAKWPRFLGAIPEDRTMLAVTVGQLAQHLDAKWVIGESNADLLVRHILIGGNIMDSGITYFGRHEDKAVVIRGDRPDIQLSALSTPTACLVLTGGHHPIPYVLNEAQQKNVPLLIVPGDTIHTTEMMDTVCKRSTIHHGRKGDRFLKLIEEHGVAGTLESIFN